MNGLGNEIVVVDLRGSRRVLSADEARTIAENPRSHFDQMMVLHDPKTPGTEAYIRIYNTDGSEAGACGNGMRCVGWVTASETGRTALAFETQPGVLNVTVDGIEQITVDMGEPKFGWADIPLVEPFHDTRNIELQVGPIDNPIIHTPSVVNVGNPHAIFWVERLDVVDLGKVGPMLEYHRLFPDRANISLAGRAVANRNRSQDVGTGRGADASLRVGGLCGGSMRGAQKSGRAHGDGQRAGWPAGHRVDKRQSNPDDGPR